jgi:hypothetical protein
MLKGADTLGIHSPYLSLRSYFSAPSNLLCCADNTISCRRRAEQPELGRARTRSILNASSQESVQLQTDILGLYPERSISTSILYAHQLC